MAFCKGAEKEQKLNLWEQELVPLRDQQAHCLDWPTGIITKVISSEDRNRKENVRDRVVETFFRLITEVVLLPSVDNHCKHSKKRKGLITSGISPAVSSAEC